MDIQLTKTKGLIYLWISTLVFAAANSVFDKLSTLGSSHPINNHNPISFCNVLFVGNLVAGIVFLVVYHKSWRLENIQQVTTTQVCNLSLMTLFSTILGPIFYFLAIMLTQVINVVLISTTEIAFTLITGYVIFREKPSMLTLLSTVIAISGVLITFYLHQQELVPTHMQLLRMNLGDGWLAKFLLSIPHSGELCAVLGAFFSVLGDQLIKKHIGGVPKSLYNTFRTFMGAIIFFMIALSLFGWGHFAEVFSPFLWQWMIVYGGIIVALAVYTYGQAAETISSDNLAIAAAFFPVAGVVFAFLIVGETPDFAQIFGGGVILVGIAVGLYDSLTSHKRAYEKPPGFCGV
jgi:drug/metabolite transporter (DMT)-like permease